MRRFALCALTIAVILSGLVISTSWPREYAAQYCEQQLTTTTGEESGVTSPVDCVSSDPNAKSAEGYQPENHWPDFWISLGTIWLVCGTFYLGFWTYRLWSETSGALRQARADSERQATEFRDQLTLAYPPKISVTSLVIWDGDNRSKVPNFTQGATFNVRAMAINHGRENATIVRSVCVSRWWPKNRIPMARRWSGDTDMPLRWVESGEQISALKPGEFGQWQWSETVPADFNGATHALFVVGHVTYTDRLKTHRAVYFCRRYDPDCENFARVPEFEGEE